MNLNKKIYIKNKNISTAYADNILTVRNISSKHGFLIVPKLYKSDKKEMRIVFKGKQITGNAPTVEIINRKKTIMYSFDFNTESKISTDNLKYYLIAIYVPANSQFEITDFYFDKNLDELTNSFKSRLNGDMLVITPGYPSESNKYNTAFVHTRVKEYIKSNINLDVLVINELPGISQYTFEGIDVIRADYAFLRDVLSTKHYKNIVIHFFDCNYGNVLDAVDTSCTNLYMFAHGADVLYHSISEYASPYFGEKADFTNIFTSFEKKDNFIKKYNNLPNVKWIFVSDFIRNKLEKSLNIEIKNYEIIPNYIDNQLFTYSKKNKKLQKKIFILRKFTNDFCYALDIDVRAILTLSRRECFNELEFDIFGSGDMFDIITAPLKEFENVHLHNKFLTHEEIKRIHNTHGIGLFASRFDTQGVSLCEAASSGCAVVTSDVEAITSYIDKNLGVVCDTENFVQYADAIERLAFDSDYFNRVAIEESNSIQTKFSYENTIGKELELFKNTIERKIAFDRICDNPVLTVIVPAYNVEKYLWNGVMSLIDHNNSSKMEVLIIDDGSKDKTAEIGAKLEELTNCNGKSIVRLISKENGGHGSTINIGIENAKGKYTKIMDGDDTVDSYYMRNLIDILENEDSDIVLNNYMEDYAYLNVLNYIRPYEFMIPGMQYNFEDLCYEGYGFSTWGPILACSSYRTDFLQNINFKLLEKCFYVDVQLNTYISLACKTIVYYPLNIYRYLLGRNGQSISKESYMKNYKHHEKVTMKVIEALIEKEDKISKCRKNYVIDMLILKLLTTQYIITVGFYNSPKPFREFESQLKNYPELYNDSRIATRAIKFHRLTNGCFIFMNSFLIALKNFFRNIIHKVFR